MFVESQVKQTYRFYRFDAEGTGVEWQKGQKIQWIESRGKEREVR